MNILFLTLCDFNSINEANIYSDLLREFTNDGHYVYIVSPTRIKNKKMRTYLIEEDNYSILKIKTGGIQKANIFKKGFNTVKLEWDINKAIKKYISDYKIDLILYSTPPITLYGIIARLKKRHNSKTYLLLKDIFPQNAVDLGIMSKRSLIYKYFRSKEKNLYAVSDFIGCMSKSNLDYISTNNEFINPEKLHVFPNCISIEENEEIAKPHKKEVLSQYGIPDDRKIFIYGGNLGIAQDIPFILKCLEQIKDDSKIYTIICGSGTEHAKIKKYIKNNTPSNIKLISELPKNSYNELVKCCDVGLIFLDYRFSIPNFPSRLLSYMEHGLPVLACTDKSTDIGNIIEEGKFGWWCPSNNAEHFGQLARKLSQEDTTSFGYNSRSYLEKHYDVKYHYLQLLKRINYDGSKI